MVYRIRDWEGIYENNRTRELREMRWLPLPIKLAGDGYTALTELRDEAAPFLGPAIFGAFVALVEVAAGCDPRGTLVRSNGAAHDAGTLARITRMPEKLVERMLSVCVRDLQWIEIVEERAAPHEGATKGATSAAATSQEGAPPEGIEDKREKDSTAAPRGAPISLSVMLAEEYRIDYCGQFPSAQPDQPMITKWRTAAEQLLAVGKTPQEIRACWRAVNADDYWRGKVFGLDKLREHWIRGKFDSLLSDAAKKVRESDERVRSEHAKEKRIQETRRAFQAGEWVESSRYDELPVAEREVDTEVDGKRHQRTGEMYLRLRSRSEKPGKIPEINPCTEGAQ